ncbi:pyridine nucleotide-disulfide oxidoreductase [Pseudonocardia kunmingensis]|uniref:Pyridine nucleotide-disulfide oxidoreductase n=1 Tax=Pseudonocardia kunmingensis TaxID=630975 RepID=A0A543DKR4_9PSEU|nr:pyridine nucleotide-disulfide oxidoreductase [Pseudonocardia kunmingensis]
MVVVGAGAAGSAAAAALVQVLPQLEVVVTGREDRLPYNRTTVNKGLLTGAVDDQDVVLPGLRGLAVTWQLGQPARSVDAAARIVELASGSSIAADAVVLATGADPCPLPAAIEPAAASRVLEMRTASDSFRLLEALRHGAGHILLADAGLLGAETAGSLRALGVNVTLVDPADRPLSTHLGATAASWVQDQHVRAGVDLRTGTAVVAVETAGGGVAVTLDDGSMMRADAVVASLGVTPAIDWLRDSGISLSNGVPVGSGMRVLDHPGIYAAGDLAAVPGPGGILLRTEHWGVALTQGRTAAASVLADLGLADASDGAASAEPPGYSMYVHGTKLTIVGWTHDAIDEAVVHGAVGEQRFTMALVDRQGRISAAVGVGGARVANRLRGLIARRGEIGEIGQVLEKTA